MHANFSLACDVLGLPGKCCKPNCNWLLPVLDLEVCVGVLTMNQGHLPPVSGSPLSCCYLLAPLRLSC